VKVARSIWNEPEPDANMSSILGVAGYVVKAWRIGLSMREYVRFQLIFDHSFYRQNYSDVNYAFVDPELHYCKYGWQEGRNPSKTFNTTWYLNTYDDVARSCLSPLTHYVRFGYLDNRPTSPLPEPDPVRLSKATSHAQLSEQMRLQARNLLSVAHVPTNPSQVAVQVDTTWWRCEGISTSDLGVMSTEFDEVFYRHSNPQLDFSHITPLVHYAICGWRQARDPSVNFSTKEYLERYPDVRAADTNPLLHFIVYGRSEGRTACPIKVKSEPAEGGGAIDILTRSNNVENGAGMPPSDQLAMSNGFDEAFYRQTNPDLDFSIISPLEHYAQRGWREGRDPSADFSTKQYLQDYPDVQAAGMNPLLHFIVYGKAERRTSRPVEHASDTDTVTKTDLAAMSKEFDEAFYRQSNPQLDFSVISPLEHYANRGWREDRDPSAEFSTSEYLQCYSDVRAADMNPLLHFVLSGRSEGRTPRAIHNAPQLADGIWEWKDYQQVSSFSTNSLEISEPDSAIIDFTVAMAGQRLGEIVRKIKFPRAKPGKVLVSIIIPCVNCELLTVECLQSLENALPKAFTIEVIVADNASNDPAYSAIAANPTIRYLRFEENMGFGPACNAAAGEASGKFLFFLNNDAQIAPGCLEALAAAAENEFAGIVGPKLVSFDGSLQEAGCLLNQDGTGTLIGFGCDPRTPRYNYTRPVEHVSAAAMLISRDLFLSLGGFDSVFAPAYCEDADLSLRVRESGLLIIYEPKALVAHHLSATAEPGFPTGQTKRQRISRNRQELIDRWVDVLCEPNLRSIAFYLPQYHTIPENDTWWGKGFTEWSNLAKSVPNYVGHDQPRFPTDLGYYDLRVPSVMNEQAVIAGRYGISGFCYFYYWFDGKRVLDGPLERILATGKPEFPFCLCWANENWTRRWDGGNEEVLLRQTYSDNSALSVIADIGRYMRSPQYIKINNRPLILIYRIKKITNPKRTMQVWRNFCRQNEIGEIYIAMVESFELSARPEDPKQYGCDISVEFPAHGMVRDEKQVVQAINREWSGEVHDYRKLAGEFMRRVDAGFPRLRSVLVGWDNTPRYPTRSLILEHSTPGAFQAWLEWTYRRTLEQNFGDERIVFILSWNEWCEGSYLEPDRRFGRSYLQAVRNALDTVNCIGGEFAT
jgi:O-antigen biosynthesis protein